MSKVLNEYVFTKTWNGNTKYPWDQWLDGQKWQLTLDVDYPRKPRKVLQWCFSGAALRYGKKIRLNRIDENDFVIQAYVPETGLAENSDGS